MHFPDSKGKTYWYNLIYFVNCWIIYHSPEASAMHLNDLSHSRNFQSQPCPSNTKFLNAGSLGALSCVKVTNSHSWLGSGSEFTYYYPTLNFKAENAIFWYCILQFWLIVQCQLCTILYHSSTNIEANLSSVTRVKVASWGFVIGIIYHWRG